MPYMTFADAWELMFCVIATMAGGFIIGWLQGRDVGRKEAPEGSEADDA